MFFPSFATAETILLKSGKKIDGQIVERTDKYIKVNISGVNVPYFFDEIRSIDGTQLDTALSNNSQVTLSSEDNFYVDQQFGIKIKPPKGWFLRDDIKMRARVVLFSKHNIGQVAFPMLSIQQNPVPPNIKDALDFSKLLLKMSQEQSKNYMFKVIEPPQKIEIGDLSGAKFIFEMRGRDGKLGTSIDYEFIQGNTAISLQYADYSETFKENLGYFEEAVKTFAFLEPKNALAKEKKLKLEDDIVTSGSVYKNEEYGITFNEPQGWVKNLRGSPTSLVGYTKVEDNKNAGMIGITVDDISGTSEIKTALDFAKRVLQTMTYKLPGIKIIKPPEMINANGIVAAAIMYDMPTDSNKLPWSTMVVFIMQDRKIIAINALSPIADWKKNMDDLGIIISSIKVRGAMPAYEYNKHE